MTRSKRLYYQKMLLDLNGADINKAKGEADDLKSQLAIGNYRWGNIPTTTTIST